jgi:hypothetical protein
MHGVRLQLLVQRHFLQLHLVDLGVGASQDGGREDSGGLHGKSYGLQIRVYECVEYEKGMKRRKSGAGGEAKDG